MYGEWMNHGGARDRGARGGCGAAGEAGGTRREPGSERVGWRGSPHDRRGKCEASSAMIGCGFRLQCRVTTCTDTTEPAEGSPPPALRRGRETLPVPADALSSFAAAPTVQGGKPVCHSEARATLDRPLAQGSRGRGIHSRLRRGRTRQPARNARSRRGRTGPVPVRRSRPPASDSGFLGRAQAPSMRTVTGGAPLEMTVQRENAAEGQFRARQEHPGLCATEGPWSGGEGPGIRWIRPTPPPPGCCSGRPRIRRRGSSPARGRGCRAAGRARGPTPPPRHRARR
jgi:hypothetical protein